MSRRLERLVLWLGATVGGGGLVYVGITAAPGTAPILLGVLLVLGVALLAVGILGFATEVVAFVNRVLPDDKWKPVTPKPPTPTPQPAPASQPHFAEPVNTDPKPEPSEVTPQHIWALFEGRMDIDARADLEPFIGKPMTVTGPLGDISVLGPWAGLEIFGANVTFAHGTFENMLFMRFDKDWLDRLRTISQGTKITVRGLLKDASPIDLHLVKCEIVKVGP